MAAELPDLSIAARELSPVEFVETLIRRVEAFDAQTHAFITPTCELARRQANPHLLGAAGRGGAN